MTTKSANTDKPQLAVEHKNCIMSSLTFFSDNGGQVLVFTLSGRFSYSGSTRNGVTSYGQGVWYTRSGKWFQFTDPSSYSGIAMPEVLCSCKS